MAEESRYAPCRAYGGTILHGGTGFEYPAKLFGIEIEPEKELLIIIIPNDLAEKVVHDLLRSSIWTDLNRHFVFRAWEVGLFKIPVRKRKIKQYYL